MKDSTSQTSLPREYWVGQDLDWEAASIPTILFVELPFWLMVPNCSQEIEVNGCKFKVDIRDDYIELRAGLICDSRFSCIYIGSPEVNPKLFKQTEKRQKKNNVPVMPRKCKTVLRIYSACNKDVLAVAQQSHMRSSAHFYLRSFCEAHIPIINHILQHYRLSTYDYFPYEVGLWDVPVWFVKSEEGNVRIVLLNYADWDEKPILSANGRSEKYQLIEATKLQSAMTSEPSAGEYELLDALNLMERGDYSGAVRRITTAIEVQLESVLRQELLKKYAVTEVEKRLKESENDFPGRLRQYEKLSKRALSAVLCEELDTTRNLRHLIVHDALRIPFHQRGQAQEAVDTGRWIFNWIENQPSKIDVREKHIGKRSLGRSLGLFQAEITSTGVIVHKPAFAIRSAQKGTNQVSTK